MSEIAVYRYEGVVVHDDGRSEIVQNQIAAESQRSAEELLEAAGIQLWECQPEGKLERWLQSVPWPPVFVALFGRIFPWMRSRPTSLELHLFFTNLASFVRTGRTIDALERVAKSVDNAALRLTAKALASHMESMRLSSAIRLYPNVFDPILGGMIAGGEQSDLAAVCDRIAEWYRERHETRLDLKAVIANPLLMAIGGLALAYAFKLGYVPTLRQIYDTYMGGHLPFYTYPTLAALDLLTQWQGLLFWTFVAIGVALGIKYGLMRFPWARMGWEWFFVHFGGSFGKLYRVERTEETAWAMSLAHSASRTWSQAFEAAAEQSPSLIVSASLEDMRWKYDNGGKTWMECFREDGILDPILRNSLEGAEGTAEPAVMCANAARLLAANASAFRRTVKELLPNILSAIVLAPIAYMVLSLLTPMFLVIPRMLQQIWTHGSALPIGH